MNDKKSDLEERCAALAAELGLARLGDTLGVRPLTGGVASDIAVVTLPGREFCAKFALPLLRVAEHWEAPVSRNAAEYAWLETAGAIVPANAPALYGRSDTLHGFAMEYLAGEDVYLWKDALLRGGEDRDEARKVADVLGRIHAASAEPAFDRTPFDNRDDFHAIRIEPYLLFTATRHPALAPHLEALAHRLYEADRILVHGDVSPKNILFRGGEPVILDAECATMGDPSFDAAFCLNHLCLKSFHLPAQRRRLLRNVQSFWNAYAEHVSWEPRAALEARICALLPALMLARIDGKSPVEYLEEANRLKIRAVACPLVGNPPATIPEFLSAIEKS